MPGSDFRKDLIGTVHQRGVRLQQQFALAGIERPRKNRLQVDYQVTGRVPATPRITLAGHADAPCLGQARFDGMGNHPVQRREQ